MFCFFRWHHKTVFLLFLKFNLSKLILVCVVFVVAFIACAFSTLTLLVGHQEEHPACKN